ncbi:MAG: anti-sigma factor domain-containing protein [Actinomycetales bacterium]
MTTSTDDLHTLTGAYAAHALTHEEVVEFEAHLRDCASCPQETRELVATAARLGQAEYDAPPPELKARIMTEIRQTRQLPPVGLHAQVVDLDERRRSRLLLGVAAAVAALAIIGGGISGGIAYRAHQDAQRAEAREAAVASVLSAPDARTVTASGPGGAHGTAVVSDSRHAAVFSASSWPAPASAKTWQLWVIDATGAHSAGLLTRRGDGTINPTYAKGIPTAGANFGVTLEPSGGSKQPTTKPVLLMPLQS